MAINYKARSLTATATEASLTLNTEMFLHITNDSLVGELILGLEESTSTETEFYITNQVEALLLSDS